MISSFVLLTIFTNCLVSVIFSFFVFYIFKFQCTGGFWILSLIALIGAYIGTFAGIVLQLLLWYLHSFIMVLLMPSIGAFLFLCSYVYLNRFNHNDD